MKKEYTFEETKAFFKEYIDTLNAIQTFDMNPGLNELVPTIVNNLDRFRENVDLRESISKHFGYKIDDKEIDRLWKGELDIGHVIKRRDSALTLYNRV